MSDGAQAAWDGSRWGGRPEGSALVVAGVVLAAGLSSRMGTNKLLLELAGEPLVRRSVRRALAGGLSPLLVVLGHDADRAAAAIADMGVTPVVNPDYAEGIATSIRAGVAALPATVDAATVVLGDMPFVTATMIRAVVERYCTHRPSLVVSDYAGAVAPPIVYDRALFAELLAMPGGTCGQRVVRRHRAEAQVVLWPAEALADVDVPTDLERARAGLAAP